MPHCELDLYDRVLRMHSQQELSGIIICGNSFKSMDSRLFSTHLQRKFPYMYNILSRSLEIPLPTPFKQHDDIFNDTSFHYFNPSQISETSSQNP
jgi:hypothetical protein